MAPVVTGRRREMLDAAVGVTAAAGLRGLTHRAVDRAAGLPEGSTSSYFRTRNALQLAVGDYVVARLSADVSALADQLADCDGTRAAELTTQLFLRWLGHPQLLLTRLELSLEASRDAELAELLTRSRAELVSVVDSVPARMGKPHDPGRAETLVGSLDGILLAALLKPQRQRRAFLTSALDHVLAPLGALDASQ